MGYPAATGRGTRAPETLQVPALAEQGWAAYLFSAPHRKGTDAQRGNGGKRSRLLKNTGRCALTALRKIRPPVPAPSSLVRSYTTNQT